MESLPSPPPPPSLLDPAAKSIALCWHTRNKNEVVVLFISINFLAGKAFINSSVFANSYLRCKHWQFAYQSYLKFDRSWARPISAIGVLKIYITILELWSFYIFLISLFFPDWSLYFLVMQRIKLLLQVHGLLQRWCPCFVLAPYQVLYLSSWDLGKKNWQDNVSNSFQNPIQVLRQFGE